MSDSRKHGGFSASYIEEVLARPPSWGTVAELDRILGWSGGVAYEKLRKKMAGLSILLRSGPETAFDDLPADFWTSVETMVPHWNTLETLRQNAAWRQFYSQLVGLEDEIVARLHEGYCALVRAQDITSQ